MGHLTVVDVVAVENGECTVTVCVSAGQKMITDAAVAGNLADAAVKAVARLIGQNVDMRRYHVHLTEDGVLARVSVLHMGMIYEAVAIASSASRAFVEALISALNKSRK